MVTEARSRHCYQVLNRGLYLPVLPVAPTKYLRQIASAVDARHETEFRARELLEEANDLRVANGQDPIGTVPGALYLASCHRFANHDI